MGNENADVLLLRRLGDVRALKYSRRCPVRVTVHLDVNAHFEKYGHPCVTIAAMSPEGDWVHSQASVVFQRHRIPGHEGGDHWVAQHGFLGPRGMWSQCYGGHIEAKLGDEAFLVFVARLIDKADRAISDRRRTQRETSGHAVYYTPCDMLRLLIGLRLCGCDVQIKRPFRGGVQAPLRREAA